MNRTFQGSRRNKPGKSVFDLSYSVLTSGDMGKLYPVFLRECVPGDVFDVGINLVIRFNPLTAPILQEINAFVHYFFVPYRLVWDDWESFITGGEDGTEAPTLPTMTGPYSIGDLQDYLGFPTGVAMTGVAPVSFPRSAYNLIYNEFYRDQSEIAEVALTSNTVKTRAWEKDYFTSALWDQQRGTAPALPISGVIEVDPQAGALARPTVVTASDSTPRGLTIISSDDHLEATGYGGSDDAMRWAFTGMEVDVGGATTFDVADLRLAFQTQRFLERNMVAGARYTEFLQGHFGVSPRDDRLDRPEYFGGVRMPIMVSEVLQTSATGIGSETTPQGNLAGHGITAGRSRVGKYRAQEFGLIMGILSVMPRRLYYQGVDRQWIKSTRYDFYFPEFAHLSEQPVYNGELWVTTGDGTANQGVFGYQERYAEMRSSKNLLTGEMRGGGDFDHWHLAEQFTSLPSLGQTFLECVPRDTDAFAAPSEDQMVMHVGNIVRAVRPMPIHSTPGLIDH